MSPQAQSYAHHRRWDPLYHIGVFLLSAVNFFVMVAALFRHPSLGMAWVCVLSAALVLFTGKVRAYALHNQNRLIRLEERLRLQAMLPDGLRSRILELSEGQLVGLRFASDAELADRVRETLDEKLSGEQIKKRIQVWRPDEYRV
ncbi:MAG: hypothetical protein JST24_10800 [Acidobacteria bacterium]|nr:hypothetical protein [Acidobacteriota bacterium]